VTNSTNQLQAVNFTAWYKDSDGLERDKPWLAMTSYYFERVWSNLVSVVFTRNGMPVAHLQVYTN
jgi:hypothetical protein